MKNIFINFVLLCGITLMHTSCVNNRKSEKGVWELTILDGKIDGIQDTGCLAAGDIDGDGRQEVFVGGTGALVWYRPVTFEKGKIDDGIYHVSIALEDVDGDGKPELFIGESDENGKYRLVWYKPTSGDLSKPWEKHVLDPDYEGNAHDIRFADIDGDGVNEMLSISCYSATPGIFAYQRPANVKDVWKKHTVHLGTFTEGLCTGDLNGDGKLEIINGPDWFERPKEGPFAGQWIRHTFAPNFREMCRTEAVDINGDGRPDLVITDSEYMDGYLSWFENHLLKDPENPWVEHRLDEGLVYSHSFQIVKNKNSTIVFVGEMDQGGWRAPYNLDARLLTYTTRNHGKTWEREILYQGEGTHQAIMYDVDNDGVLEIIGKTCSQIVKNPKLQMWKKVATPTLNVAIKHRMLDRDKPYRSIEITDADVDGDGLSDVVCGSFWYKNPTWERFVIPDIFQVFQHYDINGDGREEFIALKWYDKYPTNDYMALTSGDLWWVKPIDPINGQWEEHYIGRINGDWPHGSTIAPLLPGGKLAMITSYHDSQDKGIPPEIFEIPDDPTITPWPKRMFADVKYNEQLIPVDVDKDGLLDVAAGQYWFRNNGDGTFTPYPTDLTSKAARIGVADINGDGRKDIVIGQEDMDYPKRIIPFSPLFWLEQPEDPTAYPWKRHVIDVLRCAHSIGVADIDGDGEDEIIAGEHDPFWPYRSRCRIYAYKKANPEGTAWHRYMIDGRFEHHDGAKIFQIAPGRIGILSHGWEDKKYVHLWEVGLPKN